MTKQTIEVEGLPDGWEVIAYRCAVKGEYCFIGDGVVIATHNHLSKSIIIKKSKPSRITFEDTGEIREVNPGEWIYEYGGRFVLWDLNYTSTDKYKIWREVKETAIPLTNDETKLSLSVDECINVIHQNEYTIRKILQFIEENS